MRDILFLIFLLFLIGIEPSFAGRQGAFPLKSAVSQPRPFWLSPSPQKGFWQGISRKFVENSDDLMFISGISSIIGLLAVAAYFLFGKQGAGSPIWFLVLFLGLLLGIFSFILGLKGMKKAKKEQNQQKIWGLIGTSIGGLLTLLALIGTFLVILLFVALIVFL